MAIAVVSSQRSRAIDPFFVLPPTIATGSGVPRSAAAAGSERDDGEHDDGGQDEHGAPVLAGDSTIGRMEGRLETRGIHHVGMAVADLDAAVATYERLLGGRLEHRERVAEQGVEAASMRIGESRVELVAALGDDTPVGRFLARRGPGMHHVAYEVDDVGAALAELAAAGAELIDAAPRRGMFGLQVAFIHPDSVHGVLSEVVSRG